jgi:hypothetical protein
MQDSEIPLKEPTYKSRTQIKEKRYKIKAQKIYSTK